MVDRKQREAISAGESIDLFKHPCFGVFPLIVQLFIYWLDLKLGYFRECKGELKAFLGWT